jgi:hypothetical protein
MKLHLSAAVLGVALASGAGAAPRAQSAMECGVAADMAIVARSLAQEHIQQPQASAIMARIYDVASSDRGRQLMDDIITAAYGRDAGIESSSTGGSREGEGSSKKFAEDLFSTCMKSGGNMDPILGRRL